MEGIRPEIQQYLIEAQSRADRVHPTLTPNPNLNPGT